MRKKTLRRMMPIAREIAKLSNLSASLSRKLKNLAKRVNEDNTSNQELLAKTLEEIKNRDY